MGVEIRFYVDPETGDFHIGRHGVDAEEVEEVLERPAEDRPGRESSRVAVGQTRDGRYLKVIYVADPEPNTVFVITAYDLRGKALDAFRRRQRHRRRK